MESNKTNFFTLMAPLLGKGMNLTITLKKDGEKITVATKPSRPDLKDKEALDSIRSLVITNTEEELNEGFIDTITQPMAKVDDLAEVLKGFEADVEKAKKEASESSAKKKPSSTPAKKAPEKKPVVKKEQTPEEIAADKKEEEEAMAEDRKDELAEITELITSAEEQVKKNEFASADKDLNNAERVWKAKGWESTPEDEVTFKRIAEIRSIVKLAKIQKENEAKFAKKVEPLLKLAKERGDKYDFQGATKHLKEIFAMLPEHEGALAIKATLVEKIGATAVDQLLNK